MTTPAIRVLLQVFLGQGIFKGAAMEIQGHDITRRERVLRQLRQEEFIDNACAGHSHPTLASRCRMRGDHDPAGFLRRTQRQIRTIVEGTAHPAFRMREVLIGRQVQTGLHLSSAAAVDSLCHA
jgi:hypothetical protein